MGVQMIRKIDALLYGIGIAAVGLIACAWPVQAETFCMSWPHMKAELAAKHHEVEVGGGFHTEFSIVVLLMSPGGDTWTIAALDTHNNACIVTTGRDWFQRSIPSADERPS
jgi:hypothetical protein